MRSPGPGSDLSPVRLASSQAVHLAGMDYQSDCAKLAQAGHLVHVVVMVVVVVGYSTPFPCRKEDPG
ncbi:hypothetical protein E2C01_041903 [Portunus trituberculatus]|uniref:Uncharacterized protein n=1 Tax=Portunus trituberculatus TaxID=210409 RepID=A0A5B7FRL9_PORTR|nr:hypothetical protein [Portunus trituberculatus]